MVTKRVFAAGSRTDPASLYHLRVDDPRAEALLHLAWVRLAVGSGHLIADTPPPEEPDAATATDRAPLTDRASRQEALEALAGQVAACTRCPLSESRNLTVFGEGSPTARLVVVGEAPGAEEDRTGRPFVGPAGDLLTRMLGAIGLAREDVFIANVLKCRPPGNRSPRPDEAAACRPFLDRQLEILDAPLLLALGAHAARLLLRTERGISSLRGRFHTTPEGWRVMPTFHPAYLLRNPAEKRAAWHDLQQVAAALGLEIQR